MRLNNGTNSAPAGKGSKRTTPRRDVGGGSRFEISDDVLTSPGDDSDSSNETWEPTRRRTRVVGRNVNDLRNGRSGTPASSLHSGSSLHTGITDHQSTTSSRRRREGSRRRETFSAENEPHPYGLEDRGVGIGLLSPRSPSNLSTVHINQQRIQETSNTVYTTSSLKKSAFSRIEEAAEESRVQHEVMEERQNYFSSPVHNANINNNQNESYLFRLLNRRKEDLPFSSDSDSSLHNADDDDEEEVNSARASVSTFFSFIWSCCKLPFSYLCSCIYLLLVGTLYLEKWCLRGKREVEVSESASYATDMNGLDSVGEGSPGVARVRYELFNNSNSSSQQSNGSSVLFFSSFFGKSTSNLCQAESDMDRTFWVTREAKAWARKVWGSQNDSYLSRLLGYMKRNGVMLSRILLVMLLLYLIWFYGGPLFRNAEGQIEIPGVRSALSAISSVLTSSASYLFAKSDLSVRTEEAAQPVVPPNPSSVRIERVVDLEETNALRKESRETLAALKLTQESIAELKIKIGNMEQTLAKHEDRLKTHDDSFKALGLEISKIFSAMKEASAKEKSIEQIIQEVLKVEVGETTDGASVSLGSMFSVLKEKEDLDRISAEIDSKLKSISVEVEAKFGELRNNVVGVEGSVGNIKSDLNEMSSRIKSMESVIQEQRNTKVEVEMDIDKVKEVVLPILTKEITEKVAISCDSRKCPDSSPFYGLTVEDIELMIKRAISKYDADKTGLPDLALESAGGSILSTRCTKSSELRNSVISYWGFRLWSPPNTPRTIIQPGVVPGECWAFEGSVGDVVIKLAVPAVVTAFTLEHIPKTVSRYGHIDSAPKHFQVLGLMAEHDTENAHDFGTFTYEDNDEPLQYFPVSNATTTPYPIVELKVLSNHGNMKHTCIYRFRVHGAIDLSRSHASARSRSAEDEESTRK